LTEKSLGAEHPDVTALITGYSALQKKMQSEGDENDQLPPLLREEED
jgi:hypothetical protein